MSSKLADFIGELSKDSSKLAALKADPHKVMDAAGLSDTEKAALTSGDPGKIKSAVSGHFLASDNVVVVVVVL